MKKVLIVDDSALVRKQLKGLIEGLSFEIDIAKNGQEACDKASATDYSVITMDVNMPVMDGLTAVKKIMKTNPTPILMVSSLTSDDAPTTMQALEHGAVDYVAKPGTFNVGLNVTGASIEEKVVQLSNMTKRKLERMLRAQSNRARVTQHEPVAPQPKSGEVDKILLVGASTGGPGLIEDICTNMPADSRFAVFVVQHMPEKFTAAFAERLARVSTLPVVEAEHHMEVQPGVIYIAKGGIHMHFAKKVSGKILLRLEDSRTERFFKPSVDEMFLSAASTFSPKQMTAVLLTGIGDDGADGMVTLKSAGSHTIGESEATATVYGMPKVAFEKGGVSEQLDFPDIIRKVQTLK
jgi:two-component system, chemotaxis family, protein-glutamate methylesterase/glutaminase